MFDTRRNGRPHQPRLTARRGGLVFLSVCLLALLPASAQAVFEFGDIVLNVKSEPKGQASHGYSEYVFTVTNRSKERAHVVTLGLPQEARGERYEDYIRSVTRTVRVEPRATVQVSLLHPDYPAMGGDGLKVIIDGREQEGGAPVAVASGHHGMRGYGYSRRMRYYHYKMPSGREQGPLILASQRVGEKFRFEDRSISSMGRPGLGGPGGMPGGPGGGLVRAVDPVENWSSRWLGYSRYDGVVLTRDDLEGLGRGPADAQAIRTALYQYVEAGGTLLVLDAGPLPLPASWKRQQGTRNGVQISQGGFGICLQVASRETKLWSADTWNEVNRSWTQTAAPYQNQQNLTNVNSALPIIEDLGFPIRGLFVLLLLFTLVIGPCNLWLLTRWKRRIWLLWTVPVIALVTCTAVFGYMILAEGWQGRTRVVGFTLLDETEQRATTLGRSASYSPLTPGDGLHFSQDTEVRTQGMDGMGSSLASCDIDWTRDQHFRRGWVSARVPAHFQLRRSEGKRLERLPVTQEGGRLQATNQLGAAITKLWLADEKGKLYTAEGIAVGQQAPLTWTGKTLSGGNVGEAHRRLYNASDWALLGDLATKEPQTHLAPRTYLAVLETSPFLEPSLAGAVVRPTASYVLGLMADE